MFSKVQGPATTGSVEASKAQGEAQLVSAYLSRGVSIVGHGTTAAAAIKHLQEEQCRGTEFLFLTDEGDRFAGAVPLGELLSAPGDTPVYDLILPCVPVVQANTDREDAASLAIHTGVAALAVCDTGGRFVGAVNASALLSILRDEHLEDLHHMAGILGKSEAAKEALAGSPGRQALYRLPWLLVGMAGSAVATYIMAGYEKALEANIAIAFFVPAIVYLADAIGTQSEAVAVRGLSLSTVGVARLLLGEIGTGVLIGAFLGAIAFVAVWLSFGTVRLAGAVGLALWAAGTVATSVGSFLPWAFNRLGYDPAYGSGPVGTVIQDVLSLVIYFWIAARLVADGPG
ncbi:MAG: hypothetical protein K0R61_3603 [Microvirga sp.]|nr:hypothetical protein [Microvirga sp.]